jgi:hypothetical protein
MAPFASKAQQAFLYSHPEKIGGKEKLKEWSAATDFDKLPEHVSKSETKSSSKKTQRIRHTSRAR